MKVVHLNRNEKTGGAAIAANRLHHALREKDIKSTLVVNNKKSNEKSVIGPENFFEKGIRKGKEQIDFFISSLYKPKEVFSTGLLGNDFRAMRVIKEADLINLHWVTRGFLSIKDINKLEKTLVWTLHDMWPFTGGCHYSMGCEKYENQCRNCPILDTKFKKDLSYIIQNKKIKYWEEKNIYVVPTTSWMESCVKESKIFSDNQTYTIHNGIDVQQFKPIGKEKSREIFDLPKDKKLILSGALKINEKRKGIDYLLKGLKIFKNFSSIDESNYKLIVFGGGNKDKLSNLPIDSIFIDEFLDLYSLPILYNAADVFISPSLEEAFGLTFIESMACKTPCVAFGHNGPKDIITHKKDGYLAQYKSPKDLANGLRWITNSEDRLEKLGKKAREKVKKKFSLKKQAEEYQKLYEKIKREN